MISFLTSSAITVFLFLAMAAYLIRGKYFDGTLFPKVLIAFASIIVIQGMLALAARIVRVRRGSSCPPAGMAKRGKSFDGSLSEALEILNKKGFSRDGENRQEMAVYLEKGMRKGLLFEIVAYGALLVTLVLGLLNYGFSIRGFFTVSTGGEWANLQKNVQMLQKGFVADTSALDYEIKGTGLTSATTKAPSSITLLARDRNGKETASPRLKIGDTYDLGRVRMLYRGDGYLVFPLVMKGQHDFLPHPLYLYHKEGAKNGVYRAKLEMSEPGTRGEMEFVPSARLFTVKVEKDGRAVYDGNFALESEGRPSEGREGDFRVSVMSLGHFGKFEIMRHTYRNQIFAGLVTLLAALLARVLSRPQQVWLWAEGDSCYYYTRNRSVSKALARGKRP